MPFKYGGPETGDFEPGTGNREQKVKKQKDNSLDQLKEAS